MLLPAPTKRSVSQRLSSISAQKWIGWVQSCAHKNAECDVMTRGYSPRASAWPVLSPRQLIRVHTLFPPPIEAFGCACSNMPN